MRPRLFFLGLAGLAFAVTAQANVSFSSAPASAASGETYYVEAMSDGSVFGTDLTVFKNGSFFAGSYNGDGFAGNFTSDTGPTTVNFDAEETDNFGYFSSASTSVTIAAPPVNHAPSASLSGSTNLTVGQTGTWNFSAADSDGNLMRWRFFNSTNLNPQWTDITGLSSVSGTHSQSFASAGNQTWNVEVEDTNFVAASASLTVTVSAPNTVPTISWVATPASANVGQTYTISAHGHDNDGNLTQVNVWKAGAPFAFAGGGNGFDSDSGNATSDATAGTVTFTANAVDSAGASAPTISHTVTISKLSQATVTISPTAPTIFVGNSVTFTASGGSGTGAYTWGGSASGTGTSKTVTFATTGTFSVTVFRAADTNYLASNTASSSITVNPAPPADQAPVTISPTATTVTALGSATFTASGGSGTGAYTWGGAASGTGTSKTVTFNSSGTSSVTVFRAASSGFNASNTATASITVNPAPQPTVAVSPTSATVTAGGSATFTASGGAGAGAYTWGGAASGTGTTKTVTFASSGTSSVTVFRASDATYAASNTASATVTVTSPDTTAPTVPTGLAASSVTSTSFTLSWTASTDAVGVTAYEVFRGGVTQGTVATTSMNLTGLSSGTTYSLTVRARDAAGNWSVQSTALAVTTPAPPAITTQPAAQTVATGATVNFSVAASGTAPLAYQWRKNAVNLANGGNVSGATAATLTLTNVQAADAASYTVVVTNGSGSVTSAAAALTVNADTTAPTVPTGLAASALTSTSFTLSWTASTDAVGVTAYEVFRGGVTQGIVATTSMNLTGLSSGTTYSLTVRARDAAGNWSVQSTALAVTTTVDPGADNDSDGVPNGIETQLGTNPNSAAQSDTANQTQTKILRPKP